MRGVSRRRDSTRLPSNYCRNIDLHAGYVSPLLGLPLGVPLLGVPCSGFPFLGPRTPFQLQTPVICVGLWSMLWKPFHVSLGALLHVLFLIAFILFSLWLVLFYHYVGSYLSSSLMWMVWPHESLLSYGSCCFIPPIPSFLSLTLFFLLSFSWFLFFAVGL